MKIADLGDKEKVEEIDLRIFWIMKKTEMKFGKKWKTALCADGDSDPNNKENDTVYIDLFGDQAEEFKKGDVIKIKDGYSKIIQNDKIEDQYRITNIKQIELIQDGDLP